MVPREMKLDEFVRRLKGVLTDPSGGKFIFFIGAGCSVTSGIPGAGYLVKQWLPTLKKHETGNDSNLEEWTKTKYPEYNTHKPAKLYSKVIKDLFPTPGERQREIERHSSGHYPGFGYAVLSNLMAHENFGKNCCHIMTTNFDDLISDALYLYTRKKPLVISHSSLVKFAEQLRQRLLVFKLHGDAMLEPRSTDEETQELLEQVKGKAASFFTSSGVIFIGYGGNDESIANLFLSLSDDALPLGIYWISENMPDSKFGDWLKTKSNVIWVKHKDFDELMLLIRNEFGIPHPDDTQFKHLIESYQNTFKSLQDKISNKTASTEKVLLESAVNSASKEFDNWFSCYLEAEKYKSVDPVKAHKIYEIGMRKFGDTDRFLVRYAIFLTDICKDHDQAEKYFLRALEIAPNYANHLCNYAVFLTKNRKDYVKAEKYYLRAIEIDPNHATNLGNYAMYLYNIKKNYDQAEKYLLRALEIDPNHDINLGKYAEFLNIVRKDYDQAEKYFLKALEINPNHVNNYENYANFLKDIRKDYDQAEKFYLRALEIDPNHAINLGNYAIFLAVIRKDYDQAEKFYLRALEIDPNHAINLSNYAVYLQAIRKDYDQAENYFLRALEIDPNNANNLSNYAGFIAVIHKNYEQAEKYYLRALEVDPIDATIIDHYAVFLALFRKKYTLAVEYFLRALENDPKNTRIAGNYAVLLLIIGRKKEGLDILEKTIESDEDDVLRLGHYFNLYIHYPKDIQRNESLRKIKELINAGKRCDGWSFDDTIQKAIEDGHPAPEFLKLLSDVITNKTTVQMLEKYPEWNI